MKKLTLIAFLLFTIGFIGNEVYDTLGSHTNVVHAQSIDKVKEQVKTKEGAPNVIKLFVMYSNDEGTYLLDPSAEFENVIYVDKVTAIKYGIYDLHHGTKVNGIFDKTDWDLLGIKKD